MTEGRGAKFCMLHGIYPAEFDCPSCVAAQYVMPSRHHKMVWRDTVYHDGTDPGRAVYTSEWRSAAVPAIANNRPQRDCTMCDDTGYKDYAGFAMDPCDHVRPAEPAQISPNCQMCLGTKRATYARNIDGNVTMVEDHCVFCDPNCSGHVRYDFQRTNYSDTATSVLHEDQRVAALVEAAKPWADFNGDLPDYNHPLRCVYESGIQYAVNLLAQVLKVENYDVCDGTEEFDGDLGGTMFNIVLAAMPKDQHGDAMHPDDVRATLAKTSKERAHFREGLLQIRGAAEDGRISHPDDDTAWFSGNETLAEYVDRALDTQEPAIGDLFKGTPGESA